MRTETTAVFLLLNFCRVSIKGKAVVICKTRELEKLFELESGVKFWRLRRANCLIIWVNWNCIWVQCFLKYRRRNKEYVIPRVGRKVLILWLSGLVLSRFWWLFQACSLTKVFMARRRWARPYRREGKMLVICWWLLCFLWVVLIMGK